MSKPSEISDVKVETIVKALRLGHFREVAAKLAGISEWTLYNWMRKGKADIERGKDSLYAKLSQRIDQAESDIEAELLARVTEASITDWKAAQWIMKCKWKKRWAQAEQRDVVVRALNDLPTDESELRAQILQELEGLDEPENEPDEQ